MVDCHCPPADCLSQSRAQCQVQVWAGEEVLCSALLSSNRYVSYVCGGEAKCVHGVSVGGPNTSHYYYSGIQEFVIHQAKYIWLI